jgi:hypothetical protein
MPGPVDPDNPGLGPALMGITWTFTSLSIIVIGTRFWVRVKVTKLVHIEDWLMLLAGIFNLVGQSLITKSFTWGLGKHDVDLRFDQIINMIKYVWISTTPGILSAITARISICILLVRIFGNKTWLKWFLIVATVLQAASNIAVIIGIWAQVSPVEAVWNPTIIASRRSDPRLVEYLAYVGGAFFACGDLTCVLLPVMVVWRLNMQLRKKVGLCVILALGLFAMAMAIMKAISARTRAPGTPDALYHSSQAVIWSICEQTTVLILGCAPSLTSVTKLRISGWLNVSSSLARLVKTFSRRSTRGSSGGDGESSGEAGHYGSDAGQYYELGTAGKTMAQVNAVNQGKVSVEQADSQSVNTGRIRRTDQYSVTRDQSQVRGSNEELVS